MEKICKVCTDVAYPFFEHTDSLGKEVTIYKCITCGHGNYFEEYSPHDIAAIYHQEYAQEYFQDISENANLRHLQYLIDVKSLNKMHAIPETKVLDIGCSTGGFLDAMPKNWKKYGMEVNPVEAKYLRDQKPEIHTYSQLSELRDEFNLITMRGVIEHLLDHQELLEFIRTHLAANGGLFVAATPDFSAPAATLYKSNWAQIVSPEHIHQFSAASLAYLLAKAGLVLKHLEHPYLETPYSDWDQDKVTFYNNFNYLSSENKYLNKEILNFKHPFPGNMMSAYFQKI